MNRGGLPFARMESQDVERLLAEKMNAPHAAKSLLKALRAVAKTAVKLAVIAKDPTTGAKVYAPSSEAGFKMWEESDIAQFEARWPIGPGSAPEARSPAHPPCPRLSRR
jgi:hypothetical protein